MPDDPGQDTAHVPPDVSRQRLLFGGVYGTVLASSLASALDHDSGHPNPGYDALWILVAAVTAAAAHGYAHTIAHWTADARRLTVETVRSMLFEWPLVAAVVPTLAALLGASAGWWSESGAISVVLVVNTATLFGWGLWAARAAGQGWGPSCRVGGVDVMIGLVVVGANALSH
ncbi:hypothetical protein RVR_6499 [Actinacidiphila reveromycinica]|uniref:Integral membrane protein n=1 Tax=Actinacidiphila reveromycinica TaxID=659352 RepID=A0A7U3VQE7_9ACTN|nr:hypothetical protein [Streptomyces sp. SN-593]BBA99747.1 hypothetical protein RVR_6499 [Streptomyces sp. SN-593]